AFKALVYEQIDSWGSDTIEVEIKVPSTSQSSADNAGGMALGINITTLTEDDAAAILKHPNISYAYAAVLGQALAVYGHSHDNVNLWGVSASYLDIDSGEIEFGRFFNDAEDQAQAKVIVLGSELKETLFGDSDPLGKYVKLGRTNYKVIGVMEGRGEIMYINMDEMAFVPLRTLQKQIMGINHVSFILAKLKNPALGEATKEDLTLLMRDRHDITDPNKDDFAVSTMAEAKETLSTVLGGVTLLLIAIAGISLVVGGVGIMNIMYVSVSERVNEIGLRKAVGAGKKNILLQFLTEAVILTFAGGVIGIVLGIVFSFLISRIAASQGFQWQFIVKPESFLLAAGVAIAIGIIFGLYPAKRAADLDPIEALRFE
ncbi:MAG TPA: ABC transporter permease, partial [Patescibacteria group bacterium]|nr:ABC transporter permease [Patescibacteria group bacterium]